MIHLVTWIDNREDEKFGDGGVADLCKQCKNCMFWNGGNAFSNDYKKSSCAMYEYPNIKPIGVIQNKEDCELYEPID